MRELHSMSRVGVFLSFYSWHLCPWHSLECTLFTYPGAGC